MLTKTLTVCSTKTIHLLRKMKQHETLSDCLLGTAAVARFQTPCQATDSENSTIVVGDLSCTVPLWSPTLYRSLTFRLRNLFCQLAEWSHRRAKRHGTITARFNTIQAPHKLQSSTQPASQNARSEAITTNSTVVCLLIPQAAVASATLGVAQSDRSVLETNFTQSCHIAD